MTPVSTARETSLSTPFRPVQVSPSSTLVDEVTLQEDVNARDLTARIFDTHDVLVQHR